MSEKPDVIDKFCDFLDVLKKKFCATVDFMLENTVTMYGLGGCMGGGMLFTVIGNNFDFETLYYVGTILLLMFTVVVLLFLIPLIIYTLSAEPILAISYYLRNKDVSKGNARFIAFLSYIGGAVVLFFVVGIYNLLNYLLGHVVIFIRYLVGSITSFLGDVLSHAPVFGVFFGG